MISNSFTALVSEGNGIDSIQVKHVSFSFLKDNDVLIRVHYSALNYKDALSAKGHPGITRSYPHIPGIDAVGEVISDKSNLFKIGQKVIVSGYDLGMNTPGGFGEYISVPSHWVHLLPEELTMEEAAICGTAGITVALAMEKMSLLMNQNYGGQIANEPVLVTGASGGVGSFAVALLHKLGFQVHAVSGKAELYDWLRMLGVSKIYSREEFSSNTQSKKPLLPSKFSACIDTVGGPILESVIKLMQKEAPIAVCGNAAGVTFDTTVFPFILRGNSLLGIDSAHIVRETRIRLWQKLVTQWKIQSFDSIKEVIDINDLPDKIKVMLEGKSKGRVVIRMH